MGGDQSVAAFQRQMRPALTWLVGGAFFLFLSNAWLGVFVSLLVLLVLAILWLGLASNAVGESWVLRDRGVVAALPLLPIFGAAVMGWLVVGSIFYWSHVAPSWWLLLRARPAFDLALASGQAPPGVISIARTSGRVVFLTHNGMLGAWRGIVYDPTGRLAAARGWGGRAVPRDVRHLFGSETKWCQRLDGAWFHCHFD